MSCVVEVESYWKVKLKLSPLLSLWSVGRRMRVAVEVLRKEELRAGLQFQICLALVRKTPVTACVMMTLKVVRRRALSIPPPVKIVMDWISWQTSKVMFFKELIGGQPFLGFCERVLLTSTFVVSHAGQDEDYVPSSRTRSQLKKKRRASRVLSTGSVQPARRVRLTVPRPPTLQDSHGRDYAPPVISASRTLESRYSICLLAI